VVGAVVGAAAAAFNTAKGIKNITFHVEKSIIVVSETLEQVDIALTWADPCLTQALLVRNRGQDPMPVTAALHTYFTISDVARFHVRGLQGATYTDSLQGGARVVENPSSFVKAKFAMPKAMLSPRHRAFSSRCCRVPNEGP
jgi:D-hexose-6-phosphate mutarotase